MYVEEEAFLLIPFELGDTRVACATHMVVAQLPRLSVETRKSSVQPQYSTMASSKLREKGSVTVEP